MFFVVLLILHGIIIAGSGCTLQYMLTAGGEFAMLNTYKSGHPVVSEDEPININIYDNGDVRILLFLGCKYGHPGKFIRIEERKAKSPEEINFTVNNVKQYGNKWQCSFETTLGHIYLTIKLHIRTKLAATRMYVNKHEVVAESSPLTVRAYDAIAHYTFAVGETVIIDCRPRHSIGEVTSIYNNADSSFVIRKKHANHQYLNDTSSPSLHPLLIKLTKWYDSKYVDCKYDDGLNVFVTRLIFNLQTPNTPQSIISLKINGMKVKVRPSNYTNYNYSLLFYDGETIDLVVDVQNADDSSLLVDYDGNEHFLSNYYKTLLHLKKENDGKEMKILASDTKFTRENLTITFKHHSSDLFLTDINKGHIQKQYKRADKSLVVYYQYSDKESISIIYPVGFEIHCNSTVKLSTYHARDSRFSTGQKIIIMLEPENDGTSMKCFVNRKEQRAISEQMIITLVYNPPVATNNESSSSWIPWVVSLLIIVLVIAVILAVIMKQRKKSQNNITNVNLSIQFANIYPVEEPGEAHEPAAHRAQQPPHTIQDTDHFYCVVSNDSTDYSEVYYEPTFGGRTTPANADTEYAYTDCAHLGERHASAFDAVATRLALEKAKRTNMGDYTNLREICRPGHCVMRAPNCK